MASKWGDRKNGASSNVVQMSFTGATRQFPDCFYSQLFPLDDQDSLIHRRRRLCQFPNMWPEFAVQLIQLLYGGDSKFRFMPSNLISQFNSSEVVSEFGRIANNFTNMTGPYMALTADRFDQYTFLGPFTEAPIVALFHKDLFREKVVMSFREVFPMTILWATLINRSLIFMTTRLLESMNRQSISAAERQATLIFIVCMIMENVLLKMLKGNIVNFFNKEARLRIPLYDKDSLIRMTNNHDFKLFVFSQLYVDLLNDTDQLYQPTEKLTKNANVKLVSFSEALKRVLLLKPNEPETRSIVLMSALTLNGPIRRHSCLLDYVILQGFSALRIGLYISKQTRVPKMDVIKTRVIHQTYRVLSDRYRFVGNCQMGGGLFVELDSPGRSSIRELQGIFFGVGLCWAAALIAIITESLTRMNAFVFTNNCRRRITVILLGKRLPNSNS